MTTWVDVGRENFNGDANFGGSWGDLIWFQDAGSKAIWEENGAGGRLVTSPTGFNLPFTGPTWHIVGAADFDAFFGNAGHFVGAFGGSNPSFGSDLLFQNDNGALAIWQSNGSNVNSFPGNENQANLPNPGTSFHIKSVNDFDGNQAADILFQNGTGAMAIWTFTAFNPNATTDPGFLQGAPKILAQRDVDQSVGPTWHVVGTADIDGNSAAADSQRAGIIFQNDNGAIAAWEHPVVNGAGQFHFNIQSNLPNPGPGWHVVGVGNTTEFGPSGGTPGTDLVLQNDNGNIAIWQLSIQGGQVVRNNIGNTDPTGFNLGNPGAGWHVAGVRDMNGDGRADILLQNDGGAVAVWTNIAQNGTHGGFDITPNPNSSGHLDWHVI